jgi:N-succinyldiaminopimelate aminotransferase
VPDSFLACETHGINPGKNFIRMALVASQSVCLETANRMLIFL